jgi:glycine cleavage system H protein
MTLYFTEEHQWARLASDGLTATIGISQHAQDALGDIVFVDLPQIGTSFAQFDIGAVVESVKTAADVLMPLGGTVIEVNEALRAEPALANTDPMTTGWFMRIQLDTQLTTSELARLTPEAAYAP